MSSTFAAHETGEANPAALAAASYTADAAQSAVPAVLPVPRLLSIQSSVVYGYVGNKASNFPLQLLGFDVDPIHSCQLSNHTGHNHFSGYKSTGNDVASVADGLRKNNFLSRYSYLLTGYMSNVDFLQEAVKLIVSMKQTKTEMFYVCDPVLGDNNALYVPAAFVSIYRDALLPIADVVTPNQTEAQLLTELPINSMQQAYEAVAWLHAKGIRTVVITSMSFEQSKPDVSSAAAEPAARALAEDVASAPSSAAPAPAKRKLIHVLASSIDPMLDPQTSPRPQKMAHMHFDLVPAYFSGTGDLTTALLLAWIVKGVQGEGGKDVHRPSFEIVCSAMEKTMATLQAVIARTYTARSEELLLIQSKSDIEAPEITQKVEVLDCTEWAKATTNPAK